MRSAPRSARRPALAFLRLELADALRSRWLLFTGASYGLVFGAFVWFGLRESSVLGFTGISRVVLNMAHAVVVVLPLVALVATSQAVVRARGSGFFELFLAQPCRRSDWFIAVLGSRLLIITAPLLLVLGVAWLLGAVRGEPELFALVGRSAAVVLTLSFAFIGIGLLVSSLARTGERATVYSLVTWLVVSALHDFALIELLLQVQLEPRAVFALAASNPVEAARLAILSGVDPELSVLGPVGFFLANALGAARTFAVGVAWPLMLGVVTTWLAMRRLERMDAVG
jgi:ABC-2 type transport system permease protein